MRGTVEHVKYKTNKTRRLGTIGGTSWRYIKRLFLEDGRDYDMLSCPAHVVNNLVFETEKLKKAEKVYTCTYLVCGVCGVCEREVLEHGMYMYIV